MWRTHPQKVAPSCCFVVAVCFLVRFGRNRDFSWAKYAKIVLKTCFYNVLNKLHIHAWPILASCSWPPRLCHLLLQRPHWAAGGTCMLQSWTWRLATISFRVSSITALEDFSHDQYTSLSLMNIEYRSLELKFISSKFRISSSFSWTMSVKKQNMNRTT